MGDSTIKKVEAKYSPHGDMGQQYLASGRAISMRRWQEEPQDVPSVESEREYETVGYVLYGQAELYIEGQLIHLREGDSWVVPKGSKHQYRIIERFGAIEATSPPSHVKDRDAKAR